MTFPIKFSKWHGLGNDYVIIAEADLEFPLTPERVALICDRHYGIGADGILEWSGTDSAGFHLTIWNPDGSQAEMCGNGMRMLARHLREGGFASDDSLSVYTAAGIISPTVLAGGLVRVFMGRARLGGAGIMGYPGEPGAEALGVPIGAGGREFLFTFVDMGNPHCVIEVEDDLTLLDLLELGPVLENHELFPARANIEFMRVLGPSEVEMRVWERGVGETNACGTGACAVAVAASRLKGAVSPITVHLTGGDLVIDVGDDMAVNMTGPAEKICEGTMSEEFDNKITNL